MQKSRLRRNYIPILNTGNKAGKTTISRNINLTISSDAKEASDFSRSTSFSRSWHRSDRELTRGGGNVNCYRQKFVARIQNDEEKEDGEVLLKTLVNNDS